ncbi:glycosyltransferase [Candidatus Peregrinibacteria bacterium]|nr:glycosyltransferase [Candidatus Peregrinibacteria bacterium]
MKLLILIPAYNEEASLSKVLSSLPKNLESIDEINVLVVDDGSKDATSKIAKQHNTILIKHKKNEGLGKTFQDGVNKALELKSDILLTIDADGQFDTADIPKIIKPIIEKKADLVTGSRFIDKNFTPKNIPFIKKWGNKRIAEIISWASYNRLYDVSCGFRAYGKEALLNLNLFGKFTYTQETILDLAYKGLHIKEVPINVEYFKDRKSRIAGSIIKYAINSSLIIFRTIKDYRALKFFGFMGTLMFGLGLVLDIFVFYHFFKYQTFSPYKIFGFMGAFLNATGIMVIFIGILADSIDKVRLTQEKILYYRKKENYYNLTPHND